MKRNVPLLAVDLDEVLFPLSQELIRRHNAEAGTGFAIGDYVTYVFSDVWGHTYTESVDKVYTAMRSMDVAVQPLADACSALGLLAEHYRLIVLTSRDQQLQLQTRRWLDEHFPEVFDEVVFAGNPHTGLGHEPKGAACIRLGVSCIIDDSSDFVTECTQAGIRSILFGDYPWNASPLPAGIDRAHTWPEVVRLLMPHPESQAGSPTYKCPSPASAMPRRAAWREQLLLIPRPRCGRRYFSGPGLSVGRGTAHPLRHLGHRSGASGVDSPRNDPRAMSPMASESRRAKQSLGHGAHQCFCGGCLRTGQRPTPHGRVES